VKRDEVLRAIGIAAAFWLALWLAMWLGAYDAAFFQGSP
jgi:hypothetical protein